jgi:hypothetical protein
MRGDSSDNVVMHGKRAMGFGDHEDSLSINLHIGSFCLERDAVHALCL